MSMTRIRSVAPHSPARRAGLRVGEELREINGQPVLDVLDYKFYSYDPRLTLKLREPSGAERTVRIRKGAGEDLGLEFQDYLMDRARSCANHCIFCFVDQLPPGMRESLYFKDDDARLSFLMGNYITLTNLSQREVERIIALRISPVNVSVHSTDPEVRKKLLGSPRAARGLEIMGQLARGKITMNCQIVSCPGINDGPALTRTLGDLAGMHPAVGSVSVVPVGVTRHRQGLYPLRPYTREEARGVLDLVETFAAECREKLGTSLAWCSDEFYLLAGRPLPEEDYFENFTQLDNGVGMLTLLRGEFTRGLGLTLPEDLPAPPSPFSIATGVSAAPFLEELLTLARAQFPGLEGRVYPIRNDFFGETITVSGLVTGGDLIKQLRGRDLGERLLISQSMLRSGERVFLDDVTLDQVEEALGIPVTPVPQDGFDLLDAMLNLEASPLPTENQTEEEWFRYRSN